MCVEVKLGNPDRRRYCRKRHHHGEQLIKIVSEEFSEDFFFMIGESGIAFPIAAIAFWIFELVGFVYIAGIAAGAETGLRPDRADYRSRHRVQPDLIRVFRDGALT